MRDLVDVVAGCDLVVAARYHSVLVPLLLDVPALGLAYNPKTTELLAAVGMAERCLDIDAFEVDELHEAFRRLSAPEEAATRELRRARVAAHRAAVEEQFDRLFGVPADLEESGTEAATA